MKESGYKNNRLNVEIYGKDRSNNLSDYFESIKYYFSETYLPKSFSMLDVGGSSGLFVQAIRNAGFEVDGAVIDPDPLSIKEGRLHRPDLKFMEDYFPSLKFDIDDNAYDLVSMQALFPQMPNWKETLLEMTRIAKKFVNISLTFKLDGNTIVDKDVSYFYYLDSGERVHQVIHNIYEFINFLCIHEVRAKCIHFYGYHTKYSGHNFRAVPNSQQIKGNLFVELFEPTEIYPKRMGGAVDKKNLTNYEFFRPGCNLVIDGNKFDIL